MVKLIMHGCNGRMGQVIGYIVKNDTEAEIVAGIDIQQTTTYTFPVFTNIADCDMKADAIIDFSTAAAVPAVLDYAKAKNICLRS